MFYADTNVAEKTCFVPYLREIPIFSSYFLEMFYLYEMYIVLIYLKYKYFPKDFFCTTKCKIYAKTRGIKSR